MIKFLILLILNIYSFDCSYQNDYTSGFKRGLLLSNDGPNFYKVMDESNLNDNSKSYELLGSNLKDLNSNDIVGSQDSISPNCILQLSKFLAALEEKQSWAISVIDSFGKPSSGILLGPMKAIGEWSECRKSFNETVDVHMNYCQLNFETHNELLGNPFLGICMPDQCDYKDIAELINLGINKTIDKHLLPFNISELSETNVKCHEPAEMKFSVIFLIIIVLVLITLVGTIYDIFKQFVKIKPNEKSNDKFSILADSKDEINLEKTNKELSIKKEPLIFQILLTFSLYTNSKKLFTIKKSDDQLDCLHAIRFLSMAWVVLGHTFLFNLPVVSNPLTVFSWLQRFSFLIISNATFSVDSFFLMSGLLTSYLFMKEIAKRNNKISTDIMLKFYIHRIWRITPPYILTVLFSGFLTQYLGDGPNYPTKDGLDPNCKVNWWTNLLYVNNLVNADKMCFGISWYLANDMQFHWISPLIIIPFALGKKFIGLTISIALIFVNILVSALIMNTFSGNNPTADPNYMSKIYFTPWCRIGPFVIGLLLGYYIYKCKTNPNFKLNDVINMSGWLLSFFALGLMLFGVYPNMNINPEKHLNRAENILYQSTSRIIWAIALSFIIFSCVMKKGGIMNDIFCWPVWTPLSRLSFSAYLIHLDVLYWNIFNNQHLIFGQEINIVYLYFGNMVFTYCASLFITFLFEVPLIGLEKFIFKRK